MDRKSLSRVQIKDAAKGEVRAVFATYGTIDHDGDYTEEGAFEEGAAVVISAYGHTSWGGQLPVGKGIIARDGNDVVVDAKFFLDTTHGADTFATVKELASDGLGEWSYGFDTVNYDFGERDGQHVRVLKKQKVYEVSPVLRGAGIGTRTLSAKNHHGGPGRKAAHTGPVSVHETPVITRAWDASGMVKALPQEALPSELRTVYAWVDPAGDPESKSSYRLPHHHGVSGPANLRSCLAGIADLNSGRVDIPEKDRKAVYDHLAAHLKDADREPPELREAPGDSTTSKNRRFADEAADVMAAVSHLTDRAQDVMALRTRKGKGMSPAVADLLQWVRDDLKRLDALLEAPVEDPENPQPSVEEQASVLMGALARVTS
jgi:hypothetical protein